MSFDFPASPTEGQTFNAPGGPTYVFNSPVWRAVGQGQIAVISDTFPSNPANGQLFWESDTGILYVWYNDGNSSQWVQVGGVTTAGAYVPKSADSYNRIVNGAMQISQENGNTQVAFNTSYAADQFMGVHSSTAAAYSQRVQVTTPKGSKDRWRSWITTADTSIAAADYWQISTFIEGIRTADFQWGTAQAKQVILRFGWKAPAGTYAVSLKNSANDRSYIAAFTISAGQANTDTEQVIVIPGDTTGTWLTDTGIGVRVTFVCAVGSTYQGVAGWQAGDIRATSAITNNIGALNTFELFDVGLYLDPNTTGVAPAWVTPDYASEFAACGRYWQRLRMELVSYSAIAGGFFGATYPFPVEMRVAPSLATNADGNPTNISGAAFDSGTSYTCRNYMSPTAAGTFAIAGRTGIANARM